MPNDRMIFKTMRVLVVSLSLLVGGFAMTARAADEPGAFVQRLGDRAVEILRTTSDAPGERRVLFGQFFNDYFDVPTIGKFALGRYWRAAAPAQQAAYLGAFGRYIALIYSDRLSAYSGEKIQVMDSRADEDGTMVNSRILRPNGGPPIHIDWRVARTPSGYRITDIVVENLSMTVAQRAEFASVIERGGGDVQVLIDALKRKTDS
jgi:phospholipid transport system substrate-binding protein